ncbi:MAG TPA: hypothetical protein VJO35_12210 [Terriglobales bacterium]|nr:hypothetical protein [Terriglobales bacterium]
MTRLQNIKLGHGVVGRNSQIAWGGITLALAGLVVSAVDHVIWLAAASMALGAGAVILVPCLNVYFGNKNPGAALLEGAQLLTYQQMTLASKDVPAIQPSAPMPPPPKEPEK